MDCYPRIEAERLDLAAFLDTLTDALVHGQDIAIPLGRTPARYRST